jgi:hypothetical protein
MESPLRFQLVVAVLAIGGALSIADSDEPAVARPVLTFQDPEISESSGLVDLGDSVLTVNDSGSGPVLHLVAKGSGLTVGRTTYTDDDVVDVEALAPGPDGTVWVGDIGDNGGNRMRVSAYAVPAPTPGDRTVGSTRYDLAYRGGPRDAEALLVHPLTGRLYVVSKGVFGGQVFAAPRTLRTDRVNVLRPVAQVGGMVTDGAFLGDGRHLLLRSYGDVTLYAADGWESLATMRLPQQRQGEGLAATGTADRVLISTEGVRTDVLSVPYAEELRTALDAAPAASPGPATAEPAHPAAPGAADEDGPTAGVVAGVAAAVLVAAFGVPALLRWRRQSRSTT